MTRRIALATFQILCLAVVARAGTIDTLQFTSTVLQRPVECRVFLPAEYAVWRAEQVRFPVAYLLHCAGCDDELWADGTMYANVDSIIDGLRMIAVAADDGTGQHGYSWWMDSPKVTGSRMATFVADELRRVIDSLYPTMTGPMNTALSGHSMGGFGSMHLLIERDNVFGLAAPIKAGLDIRYPRSSTWPDYFGLDRLLGVESADMPNWGRVNVLTNAHRLAGRTIRLRIYNGLQDTWFRAENERLHALLDSLNIRHEYRAIPEDHFTVRPVLMREVLEYFDTTFTRAAASRPVPRVPQPRVHPAPRRSGLFDLHGKQCRQVAAVTSLKVRAGANGLASYALVAVVGR